MCATENQVYIWPEWLDRPHRRVESLFIGPWATENVGARQLFKGPMTANSTAIPSLLVVLGLRSNVPTASLSSWPSAPTKHSCSWVLNCWCPPLRCPQPPVVCGRRPPRRWVSRKHDVWWGVPAEHDACWALGKSSKHRTYRHPEVMASKRRVRQGQRDWATK